MKYFSFKMFVMSTVHYTHLCDIKVVQSYHIIMFSQISFSLKNLNMSVTPFELKLWLLNGNH